MKFKVCEKDKNKVSFLAKVKFKKPTYTQIQTTEGIYVYQMFKMKNM